MQPQFSKIADRSYAIESDVDEAIQFLSALFNYVSQGTPTDLYWHRWRHDGPAGRTLLILFRPNGAHPPRLSVMGPHLADVDALAVESAVA